MIAVVITRGWQTAKLLIVDKFCDGRAVATHEAPRIPRHIQCAEIHIKSINQHELSDEEFAEYQRLCSAESPDFIVDGPDYYAFLDYTMLYAVVA